MGRLAATLLENGMRREDFAAVQTRIDLLDRYWDRRVIDSTGGDDREAVLRKVLSEMVSKRRLQVDREAAGASGLTGVRNILFQDGILVGADRKISNPRNSSLFNVLAGMMAKKPRLSKVGCPPGIRTPIC